jgi:hypothetical protein
MASRHGSDELFATYQNIVIDSNNLFDINYKRIVPISSPASFKVNNFTTEKDRKINTIRGYDLSGKLLFVKSVINEKEINLNINREYNNQIIIVKFEYDDKSISTNKYLFANSNTLIIK